MLVPRPARDSPENDPFCAAPTYPATSVAPDVANTGLPSRAPLPWATIVAFDDPPPEGGGADLRGVSALPTVIDCCDDVVVRGAVGNRRIGVAGGSVSRLQLGIARSTGGGAIDIVAGGAP